MKREIVISQSDLEATLEWAKRFNESKGIPRDRAINVPLVLVRTYGGNLEYYQIDLTKISENYFKEKNTFMDGMQPEDLRRLER